jgi:glycolate oxidase FAD binding subunit
MASSSTTSIHQVVDYLAGIAGFDHVRAEENVITVSPADTQQMSAVLTFAGKNRLSVCPLGGGTKLHWGGRVVPDIFISLARLNQVIEHPWQDLTCTVQAGCTWSKLQQSLAAHGQFVALDPILQSRATVGGILSTNDSGVLRQRYGSLRDLVIGMTLVLPDGTIARTGGKVVKNVAGYDLSKLLTGSLGTLAIITEANFRLHSLPRHERSFTVLAQRASPLESLLAAIRASHLLVQSLQLRSLGTQFSLDVKLNAHPEAHQEDILLRMVRQEGLLLEDAPEEIWRSREAQFASDSTILRISTLPTQLCVYADHLHTQHSEVEITSVSQAIGLHSIALRGSPEKIASVIQKLRADVAYPAVTVAVLNAGPGVEVPAFYILPATLSLMKAVKDQFDPDNILSPGKYFAGTQ